MTEHTKPNDATRQADRDALDAEHGASEVPTPEEEQLADTNQLEPGVEEHYQEMTERGAHQQGEGRI
jgi:hypothetical protein